MFKISLPQKNLTLEASSGSNLMIYLQEHGVPVASSCLGEGICSMCKVQIEGYKIEPNQLEKDTLLRNKCEPNERLSCQIEIQTDLIIRTKYW